MGSRQQEKVVLRQKRFQFQHGFSENSAQHHIVIFYSFFLTRKILSATLPSPAWTTKLSKKPLSLSLSFCTLQPLPVRFRLMLNSEKKIKHHLNEISNSKKKIKKILLKPPRNVQKSVNIEMFF